MERMTTLRRALAAAGLLLAALLLGTCSNPFDLLGILETEVKIGTGKFLTVKSVTPGDIENVTPGQTFSVVFDRELDESTITQAAVAYDPPGGIDTVDLGYTAATKTLTVHASPYMTNMTAYTVRMTTALRGLDGSALQEDHVWGFTTGTYPVGSVYINANEVATSSKDVTLTLEWTEANEFRYSFLDEANLLGKGWTSPDYVYIPSDTPDLSEPDGQKTVWVQFRSSAKPTVLSLVQTDTIYLDRVAPSTVEAGPTRYLNASTYLTGVAPVPTAIDATSGIASYLWSGPAQLSFSSTTVKTPTITASAEGTYTATFRATDYVDLWAQDTVSIVRDTVLPANPVPDMDYLLIGKYYNTVDTTPTWAWTSGDGTGPYDGTDIFSLSLKDNTSGKILDERKEWLPLSYTFKEAFRDGYDYALTVTERDPAGNARSRAWAILVSPVVPYPRAEEVPTRIAFQWRIYNARYADHYSLFLNDLKVPYAQNIPVPKLEGQFPGYTPAEPIARGKYQWQYAEYDYKGGLIYKSEIFEFITQ